MGMCVWAGSGQHTAIVDSRVDGRGHIGDDLYGRHDGRQSRGTARVGRGADYAPGPAATRLVVAVEPVERDSALRGRRRRALTAPAPAAEQQRLHQRRGSDVIDDVIVGVVTSPSDAHTAHRFDRRPVSTRQRCCCQQFTVYGVSV